MDSLASRLRIGSTRTSNACALSYRVWGRGKRSPVSVKRSMLSTPKTLSLVMLLVTGACSGNLRVETSAPDPTFHFRMGSTPGILRFGVAVDDAFEIPRSNGIGPVRVRGWRATIQNGFDAGFRRNARTAEVGKRPSVLVLTRAQLSFVSRQKYSEAELPEVYNWSGLMAHGSAVHGPAVRPSAPAPVHARIDFDASLSRGASQAWRMRASVFSEFELQQDMTPSLAAQSAVEAMYVAIATKFRITKDIERESQ